jgi:hypothetical protein
MPRYLVTTRRKERNSAMSALDAVKTESGVKVVNSNNPESVTIEATEDAASRLRAKLNDTHFVEPEIRRSLH